MARLTTHLGWDLPLLPQLARHLCARAAHGRPWDLSTFAVVVPTRQAGRRLRQRMAEEAANAGTGLLPPLVLTPDALIGSTDVGEVATTADSIGAWVTVLQETDLSELAALFPEPPLKRDAAWAADLVLAFHRLQDTLAAAGQDFALVAEKVAGTAFEPERWAALAALEAAWRARLRAIGLTDPWTARVNSAAHTRPPDNCRGIVLAGAIELSPLHRAVLSGWENEGLELEIVVHAPPGEKGFDAFGQPDREAFARRHLPLDTGRCRLHLLEDPEAVQRWIVEAAAPLRNAPSTFAIGLADPALAPQLLAALADAQLPAHDPGGRPLVQTPEGQLASLLCRFAQDPSAAAVTALARHPAVGRALERASAEAFTQGAWLLAWDKLLTDHLPDTLDAALASASRHEGSPLAPGLRWLSSLAKTLALPTWGERLKAALHELLEGGAENGPDPDASEALADLCDTLRLAEERQPDTDRALWTTWSARQLAQSRLFRPGDGWDLQGWIELLFEDAPHLAVAGLNEGRVPETLHGDAFLPESLRAHLGLPTNADRLARDAYLLEAFVRSRSANGRVDLLIAKRTADNEPLQPSRLLFACPDSELTRRARSLFASLPPATRMPARRLAWRLTPRPAPPLTRTSPSALRSYLACPFRYYLRHVLGMEPLAPQPQEMDAAAFGNLCHKALEGMLTEPGMNTCADPALLADFLEKRLRGLAAHRYGDTWNFPVRVQVEAAVARLRAAAEIEAGERAAGWRTVAIEQPWTLEIDGVIVSGRIDRIDEHVDGRRRIIDYKTADDGKSPREAHWARAPRDPTTALDCSLFERDGEALRWIDLQLPLYALASTLGTDGAARGFPSVGYFVLPKTKDATALLPWDELTREDLAAAEACLRGTLAAIRGGRFWPPTRIPADFDPYAPLFPEGIEAGIDPLHLQSATAGEASR